MPPIPAPAGTVPVLLVAGPCDGRTVRLSPDQAQAGWTRCGGQVYVYIPDSVNPWRFQLASDFEKRGPEANAIQPTAIFPAFHALMRALAYYVPAQLRRERLALNRIRRAVR